MGQIIAGLKGKVGPHAYELFPGHQYEKEIFELCKLYQNIKLEENNGLRTAAVGCTRFNKSWW